MWGVSSEHFIRVRFARFEIQRWWKHGVSFGSINASAYQVTLVIPTHTVTIQGIWK